MADCAGTKENGQPCRSPKLKDNDYCLMHSPEHAEEVAESRRLGGLRRRLLEVAVLDTLGLENSISRARTLAYLATTAIKLLEVGEFEQRLAALETVMHGQKTMPKSVFDIEPVDSGFSVEVGE